MFKYNLLLLFMLLQHIYSKNMSHILTLARFQKQNNFVSLGKMNFGIGKSEIKFEIKIQKKYSETKNLSSDLYFGLAIDDNIDYLIQKQTCQQKQQYLNQRHLIGFDSDGTSKLTIQINHNTQEHLWYYYIYSCQNQIQKSHTDYQILFYINIVSLNNSSHFGQNQNAVWIYLLAFLFSIIILPKNIQKFSKDYKEQQIDYAHLSITLAIIFLTIGYFYKLIHLFYYSKNGYGIDFLDVVFLIFRTISQSIVVTLITAIAWGWTINFIKNGKQQLFFGLGVLGAILNIISTALGKITDDSQRKHHHFDCVTGIIILIFRLFTTIVFLVGIIKTYKAAKPKTKLFVIQFGIVGGIYIGIYPLTVLICQLILPAHMQNEIITGMVEISHAIVNSLLTLMIASSNSSYCKMQYNIRTVFKNGGEGKIF